MKSLRQSRTAHKTVFDKEHINVKYSDKITFSYTLLVNQGWKANDGNLPQHEKTDNFYFMRGIINVNVLFQNGVEVLQPI